MNVSLFSVNKTYDYQALCEPTREPQTGAGLRSVYVVSFIFEFISIPYDSQFAWVYRNLPKVNVYPVVVCVLS